MASTGILRGRVTSADTGAPIHRAAVTVWGYGLERPSGILTDEDGVYEFAGLRPGEYRLAVSKDGFVQMMYGPHGMETSTPIPIELSAGETLEQLDLALLPGAIIEGQVVDEFGEAVVDAPVELHCQGMNGWVRMNMLPRGSDDRGRFRLWGVPPGTYLIASSTTPHIVPSDFYFWTASTRTHNLRGGPVPTFYPGTLYEEEAQAITVTAGQTIRDLTFAIRTARLARITGTVMSSGAAFVGGIASIVRVDRRSDQPLQRNGTFVFDKVPPGPYVVSVKLPNGEGAVSRVVLAHDDVEIALVTTKTATLRGKVRFHNVPPGDVVPEDVRPCLHEDAAIPSGPRGLLPGAHPTLRPDWTFEMTELLGAYRVYVAGKKTMVTAILRDGVEQLDGLVYVDGEDVQIEVVMARCDAAVSGYVVDGRARVGGAAVLIFSRDPLRRDYRHRGFHWKVATNRGNFHVEQLPAGEYLAIALRQPLREHANPMFIESLRRRAIPLTLIDGNETRIELEVTADD